MTDTTICWACGKSVEYCRTTTVLGVPGARVCYKCDDETKRTRAVSIGKAIREYDPEKDPE